MAAGVAYAAEVQKFVMGSGPMGGPWRIGVGAAAQMINEQFKDKYFITVAASGGSVENLRRLVSGEYHTSWAHINNMVDAWNGMGLFEGQKPYKDIRVLEYIVDQALCVATLAKSPIKNFADLAGKKVNLGPAGSGGVFIAKAIFQSLGLTDKIKMSYLNFEGGAQALKDGQLDVNISPGGPYVTPSVVEISRSVPIRLVQPTPEESKKIEAAYPYLYAGVIPPNKAPGENADKERKAFFWAMYWVAQASMPEQAVYDILKATQEPKNKELLGKVLNYWTSAGPDFSSIEKIGIPIHPGAVKFWKEKGAKLPEKLIK
jgi:hypothetical protein